MLKDDQKDEVAPERSVKRCRGRSYGPAKVRLCLAVQQLAGNPVDTKKTHRSMNLSKGEPPGHQKRRSYSFM